MHLLEVLNPIGQQRGMMNSLTISPSRTRSTTRPSDSSGSGTHGVISRSTARVKCSRAVRQRDGQLLHRRQLPGSAADRPAGSEGV